MDKQHLKRLLQRLLLAEPENVAAHRCLEVIDQDTMGLRAGDSPPFSAKKMYQDYSIRASLNEDLAGTEIYTIGYQELLDNLKTLPDDVVYVFSLFDASHRYWLITDREREKLVGVLCIPNLTPDAERILRERGRYNDPRNLDG